MKGIWGELTAAFVILVMLGIMAGVFFGSTVWTYRFITGG